MGFLGLIILVWAVAMGAWFVVSKYFKSSDMDRIKARLTGTTKAKAAKKAKTESGKASVIQSEATVKGLHFLQEDSPHEIGRALQEFVKSVRR